MCRLEAHNGNTSELFFCVEKVRTKQWTTQSPGSKQVEQYHRPICHDLVLVLSLDFCHSSTRLEHAILSCGLTFQYASCDEVMFRQPGILPVSQTRYALLGLWLSSPFPPDCTYSKKHWRQQSVVPNLWLRL